LSKASAFNADSWSGIVRDGGKTKEVVVEEYMNELVERAGEEVKMSIVNTDMLHDWDRFLESPIVKAGGHANQTNKIALEEQRHREALANGGTELNP